MNVFKKNPWASSLLILTVMAITISSCDDDGNEDAKKVGINFETDVEDTYESIGTYEVDIVLDEAPSEKVLIAYTLSGSAILDGEETGDDHADYDIDPAGGYITIEAGISKATLTIDIYEEADLEFDIVDDELVASEDIIITLTEVVSGPAKLGELIQYTLNIYEDDLYIEASWDEADDADLDIFVWIDDPETTEEDYGVISYEYVGGVSANVDYEVAIIPAGLLDGDYGTSFTYYEGTSDDLNFDIFYFNFGGYINTSSNYTAEMSGHYTLANVNTYDADEGAMTPIIAQNFEKSGLNYTGLSTSDISTPATGSRLQMPQRVIPQPLSKTGIPLSKLPPGLRKMALSRLK